MMMDIHLDYEYLAGKKFSGHLSICGQKGVSTEYKIVNKTSIPEHEMSEMGSFVRWEAG
jgi:hypothetical protein